MYKYLKKYLNHSNSNNIFQHFSEAKILLRLTKRETVSKFENVQKLAKDYKQ